MKNYLILFAAVILIFAGIVLFTGFLGNQFGKTVELIVLGIVAVVLLVLYIKSKRS
ncbi:MAG: hypothetical protein IKJ77_07585 [Firmicutes bacterium]|nr:hypothetical protein [Bacillota bacterium]